MGQQLTNGVVNSKVLWHPQLLFPGQAAVHILVCLVDSPPSVGYGDSEDRRIKYWIDNKL